MRPDGVEGIGIEEVRELWEGLIPLRGRSPSVRVGCGIKKFPFWKLSQVPVSCGYYRVMRPPQMTMTGHQMAETLKRSKGGCEDVGVIIWKQEEHWFPFPIQK